MVVRFPGDLIFVALLPLLFQVLEKAKSTKEVTVAAMMDTWIKKMGYPMVTLTRVDDSTVRLSQEIYLTNPSMTLHEVTPSGFDSKEE